MTINIRSHINRRVTEDRLNLLSWPALLNEQRSCGVAQGMKTKLRFTVCIDQFDIYRQRFGPVAELFGRRRSALLHIPALDQVGYVRVFVAQMRCSIKREVAP